MKAVKNKNIKLHLTLLKRYTIVIIKANDEHEVFFTTNQLQDVLKMKRIANKEVEINSGDAVSMIDAGEEYGKLVG